MSVDEVPESASPASQIAVLGKRRATTGAPSTLARRVACKSRRFSGFHVRPISWRGGFWDGTRMSRYFIIGEADWHPWPAV
ncbi:MAG: hypothetical protein ABSG76_10775 [Xanthobacteraceae bacterium]|jgi:hypothetical protein